MPVYDYKCVKCGHRFDLLRSVSDRDNAVCPRCNGPVARVYEGKWATGSTFRTSSRCSCGGNCKCCAGCGK